MLTVKTFFGVGWSVASRLISRIIDFAVLIILSRALGPAAFGVVALATSIVSIAEMVLEIPVVQALTSLPDIHKSHLDTAFTLGLLRGIILALFLILISYPYSQLYHDPRLTLLIVALSITPIMRGLYSPGMLRHMRNISFKEIFATQILGKLIAAFISFALLQLQADYWVIVTFTVSSAFFATLTSYFLGKYNPALTLSKLKDFQNFIGWFSGAQIIAAFSYQLDRILLGRAVNSSVLGYYTMAGDIAVLPTQSVIGPAMVPLMAAFGNIGRDEQRLKAAFLKAALYTMMLGIPASVMIALTSDLIVKIMFDEKWKSAGPMLGLISLTISPVGYFQVCCSLASAVNKPRTYFEINLLDLSLKMILVPTGLYFASIDGVIGARGIIAFVGLAASIHYAKKLIGVTLVEQIWNLRAIGAATLAMSSIVIFVLNKLSELHLRPIEELALAYICGGVTYAVVLQTCGVQLLQIVIETGTKALGRNKLKT